MTTSLIQGLSKAALPLSSCRLLMQNAQKSTSYRKGRSNQLRYPFFAHEMIALRCHGSFKLCDSGKQIIERWRRCPDISSCIWA